MVVSTRPCRHATCALLSEEIWLLYTMPLSFEFEFSFGHGFVKDMVRASVISTLSDDTPSLFLYVYFTTPISSCVYTIVVSACRCQYQFYPAKLRTERNESFVHLVPDRSPVANQGSRPDGCSIFRSCNETQCDNMLVCCK